MSARISLGLLLLATLAFGLFGIERSLWTDEAWVANSAYSPTWREMFYYPAWLQTTPPLFLLLQRTAVAVLGLSTPILRVVPLALQLAAVGLLFFALRKLSVPLPATMLATMSLAVHPVAIEYSRTCKQYSGEVAACAAMLAAATVYFGTPSRRSFGVLLLTAAIALPLAYPAVFLLPGLVLATWFNGDRRRAARLAAASTAIFAILYLVFLRANYSPALREFWAVSSEHVSYGSRLVTVFLGAAALAKFLGSARHRWMYFNCGLPGLLLAASSALGWYPSTPRTWLFVLPGLAMLLAMFAAELLQRWPRLRPALWCAVLILPMLAAWRQVRQHRELPVEDFAGAVGFLRQHAAPADLLLVHPSVKEGFELYANMERSGSIKPVYGATGWPCCVRGHLAPPHSSTKQAVIDDLQAKIPPAFSGRVWLIFSTRPTQWDYVGLDEGKLWRSQVWAMGCPPEAFVAFTNIAVSPMNCSARPEPRK